MFFKMLLNFFFTFNIGGAPYETQQIILSEKTLNINLAVVFCFYLILLLRINQTKRNIKQLPAV